MNPYDTNPHDTNSQSIDPYIAHLLATLGDADPIEVLASTSARLEVFAAGLFDADWERSYAPDAWSAREIVAHLADVELALGYRFRQALAESGFRFEPFDQDRWATRYRKLDPALALAAFGALRAWNLALFATFDLADWLREVDYPLKGVDSVDGMVRVLAGHDLNHWAQLQRLAEAVRGGSA